DAAEHCRGSWHFGRPGQCQGDYHREARVYWPWRRYCLPGNLPAGVPRTMTEALRSWRMDWPGSRGRRPGQAVLKACPEDFRVDEVLDRLADESEVDDRNVAGGKDGQVSGAGEHLCLRLR